MRERITTAISINAKQSDKIWNWANNIGNSKSGWRLPFPARIRTVDDIAMRRAILRVQKKAALETSNVPAAL